MGFPAYEVSDTGLLRHRRRGRLLSQRAGVRGRRTVHLWVEGRGRNLLAHRLVLQTFVGPCPEGMECRHLDGNASNNHLSNLDWGTAVENAADRRIHGTHPSGARNPRARLEAPAVREIRRLGQASRTGATFVRLAREHGVSRSTVEKIVYGSSWTEFE